MGTSGTAFAPPESPSTLGEAVNVAQATSSRIQKLLDAEDPDSEISAVNRVGGMVRLPVSSDTYRILHLAQEYNLKTEGCFDVTVAPLRYLWGFQKGSPPDNPLPPELLEAAMRGIGREYVRLYENSVELPSSFTRIDLRDIYRGYAVDLSILKLRKNGVRSVMLDIGGRRRCLGTLQGNHAWHAEISNPFHADDMLGSVLMSNGMAVATASIGDNYVMIGGKKYGHIIDPRTGLPVEGLASVTVTASTATKADALSSALFVAGMDEANQILENFPGSHAIFIPDREPVEIWLTQGAEACFKPASSYRTLVRTLGADTSL